MNVPNNVDEISFITKLETRALASGLNAFHALTAALSLGSGAISKKGVEVATSDCPFLTEIIFSRGSPVSLAWRTPSPISVTALDTLLSPPLPPILGMARDSLESLAIFSISFVVVASVISSVATSKAASK